MDPVGVHHGTIPRDDVYFEPKSHCLNQAVARNPQGRFQLFRIGDAVPARNRHAAIDAARRIARDF